MAAPLEDAAVSLYRLLHALLALRPSPALGPEDAIAFLHSPQRSVPIEARQSDGLVNTVSMVWPDLARTRLVEADHLTPEARRERRSRAHGRLRSQ